MRGEKHRYLSKDMVNINLNNTSNICERISMTDQYQNFSHSVLGQFVTKNLGLPQPPKLQRYQSATPVLEGALLLGAAKESVFTSKICQVLHRIHANCYAGNDQQLQQDAARIGLNIGAFNAGDKESKFKALLFDASGIQSTQELQQLYAFFQPVMRQISASGRVVVVGLHADQAKSLSQAIAQRALQGFIKSLSKELKKGSTAQLLYVDQDADIESSLRFVLSPRSAYVSGQVLHIQKSQPQHVDWQQPLAGKTALVTGASRGIGAAIAQVLARDGAHVICLDIQAQAQELAQVAASIHGSVCVLDITQAHAGTEILAAAQAHGGLDILVHNAGITRDKMLANMPQSAWESVLEINLSAIERINQHVLTHEGLNPEARLICISSISGIAGNLGQSNYATSKAGVIGLVEYTAPTLPQGMTINAVAPGFIETQMTDAIPFAIREAGRRMNAMKQGGLPVDVAEAIAFFANPASGGLNGNVLRVCGHSILGA